MAKPRSGGLFSITYSILIVTAWTNLISGSVIRVKRAASSSSSFDLETNIVSCSLGDENSSDSLNNTPSIVCSPPESKLFKNLKVLNGTPHPGPSGLRGRLYDVGQLCENKIAEKIDRAWVAYLDCGGCPLATKLSNLQNSNPQAIILYNQASCSLPASPALPPPLTPSTTTTTSTTTSPSPSPSPSSSVVTPSPAPATDVPTPSSTQPADPSPSDPPSGGPNGNGGDGNGGDGNGGDGNGGDGNGGGGGDGDGDNGGNGDSGNDGGDGGGDDGNGDGDGDEESFISARGRRKHTKRAFISDAGHSYGIQRVHLVQRDTHPDLGKLSITYPFTIAYTEKGTTDYIFNMLTGPASAAPVPAAIKAANPNASKKSLAVKASETDNKAVTDLMVSITQSDITIESESGGVCMSKAAFGILIAVLCAIIIGIIFFFVVRPYIKQRRHDRDRKDGMGLAHEDEDTACEINRDSKNDRDYKSAINYEKSTAETKYLNEEKIVSDTEANNPERNYDHTFENSNQPFIPVSGNYLNNNGAVESSSSSSSSNCNNNNYYNDINNDGGFSFQQTVNDQNHTDNNTAVKEEYLNDNASVASSGQDSFYNRLLAKSSQPDQPKPEEKKVMHNSNYETYDYTKDIVTNEQFTSNLSPIANKPDNIRVQIEPSNIYGNKMENYGNLSASSRRNGSDLLFEDDGPRVPRPPKIDTDIYSREVQESSNYPRQRKSMDLSFLPYSASERVNSSSFNDFAPPRHSMDSHRPLVQPRRNDSVSSRNRADGTPRASFSEDFPSTRNRMSWSTFANKNSVHETHE